MTRRPTRVRGAGPRSLSRVLVTDAQERASIAAIRCLSAGGLAVTGVAASRSAPGLWSRACSLRVLAPDPREDVAGFITGLEGALRRTPHDLLVPATDAALYAVSAHRDRLAESVNLRLPAHEAVEDALDRTRFHEVAGQVGLAPPATRLCHRIEEVQDALAAFGLPAIVKPSRVVREQDGRVMRWGSRPVLAPPAFEEGLPGPPPWIVQRWSTGVVTSVAGVATEAGLGAALATRYRRLWPPESGDGSFVETVPLSPHLRDQVEQLVSLLGWLGIFQLELIDHGGELVAVDFNPRPYGSMGIARAAGVPLATVWAAWCRGEPLEPTGASIGVRYRWGEADLRHAAWRLRRGHWDSVGAVVRPRREVTHAFFERDDPLPAVAHGLRLMTRALSYPGRDQDSRA